MGESENIETFDFKKYRFTVHPYHDRIFLDFNVADHYRYAVDKHKFRYFEALKNYLEDNENTVIYLTDSDLITNFKYYAHDIVVHIDSFVNFCSNIGDSKKNKARAKAFFGQHISLEDFNFSDSEKQNYLQANLTEADLLNRIKNFNSDSQKKLLDAIFKLESKAESSSSLVSNDNFISIFTKFISDSKIQNSVLELLPQIQLNTLKELKVFVESNLHQNETFFQDWIDEEEGKYRKQRCLIFGIEYIDPKREGEIMGRKRFDILATQNRQRHIIIELKSPTAEIFEVDSTPNKNDGVNTCYKLSKELSRAIPQILGYKKFYNQLNSETIKTLGLAQKLELSECIIVIGQRKDDTEWSENFKYLCDSMNIKIVTYTDLIEKMDNTITNIELHL